MNRHKRTQRAEQWHAFECSTATSRPRKAVTGHRTPRSRVAQVLECGDLAPLSAPSDLSLGKGTWQNCGLGSDKIMCDKIMKNIFPSFCPALFRHPQSFSLALGLTNSTQKQTT